MTKVPKIGLQISEKEYRKLPFISYSLMSAVAKHGRDAIFNSNQEDIADKDGVIIGSIADSKVTEHKEPDNLVVIDKKPSSKSLNIIKDLIARTDLKEPKNPLSVKNEVIIDELCTKYKYYDKKSPRERVDVLKKYNKYAKTLMSNDKDVMIASNYHYKIACESTKQIFNRYPFLLTNKENIVGQVKIQGDINFTTVKAMLDFIVINWDKKIITPFDLKTGAGKHYEFFRNGYLGWGYYIQASLYRHLLMQLIKTMPEFEGFTVSNFRFLFCGRGDQLPIIYKVTDKQHESGFTGFDYKGDYYPGIYELMDDINHYKNKPNSLYRRGYDQKEVVFDDSYL
jgi:hypothetical protein